MDIAILIVIGLGMGLIGGLLGIGGSVIMIPALTLFKGENQHLYQAAAMICNFFVSAAAMLAHRKAQAFVKNVLIWLIPAAVLGITAGVALSNCTIFEGGNSYLLARAFGAFLVYVIAYNSYRLYLSVHPKIVEVPKPMPPKKVAAILSALCGGLTGLAAGLLGIGAGTVATPLQQVTLKLPLRNAMSNSAVTIVSIAWLGAIYKNATLPQHGLEISESLKIAACVIPGAIVGGYWGGHLMHALPKNIVRAVFIGVCILAAVKLLTVSPS
ncbi:MAG: sulfite exporter TauE/SafE family protein [Phycisphaerae bacterium]|nr:sulfite exporter TauE/SafE family protein [Phycisphaerae bacterium]